MDQNCDTMVQIANEEGTLDNEQLELVETSVEDETSSTHDDADLHLQFEKIHDRIRNTLSLIEEATNHVKSITFAEEYAHLKDLQETDFGACLEADNEHRPNEKTDDDGTSAATRGALSKDVEDLKNTIENTLLKMT